MQSDLDKFLARLVQSLLVLVRREERESSLLSLKSVVERIVMLADSCCVKEWTFFFSLYLFSALFCSPIPFPPPPVSLIFSSCKIHHVLPFIFAWHL